MIVESQLLPVPSNDSLAEVLQPGKQRRDLSPPKAPVKLFLTVIRYELQRTRHFPTSKTINTRHRGSIASLEPGQRIEKISRAGPCDRLSEVQPPSTEFGRERSRQQRKRLRSVEWGMQIGPDRHVDFAQPLIPSYMGKAACQALIIACSRKDDGEPNCLPLLAHVAESLAKDTPTVQGRRYQT